MQACLRRGRRGTFLRHRRHLRVPVGSQALQSRYFVNLSSATIRSELAELSDLGYLAQPHTSAGRVPTDSGYRYFVDFLMDLEPIPDKIKTYIHDELRAAPADVE